MSLFGGDAPAPPASDSDFSISPISPRSSDNEQDPDTERNPFDAQVAHDVETSSYHNASNGESDEEREDLNTRQANIGSHERDRFAGSDSVWRHHTQDETALAKSLDDIRANDLSAHLYNTHAWKARLRADDAPPSAFVRKSKWIAKDENDSVPWYPDTKWTAWPLESSLITASDDVFWRQNRSGDANRGNLPQPPSTILSAALVAISLRMAKSQWHTRPLAELEPWAQQADPRDEALEPPDSSAHDPLLPVILSDDSEARRILNPAISSAMSRLDGLLTALHHNRAGHHAYSKDDHASKLRRTSLSRSRTKSADMRSRSRRRASPKRSPSESGIGSPLASHRGEAHSMKRRKVQSSSRENHEDRGRTSRRASSVTSTASSASDSDGGHERSTRDWSEVLGLAALCGWDHRIVKRAQIRCSELFNESMDFTSMGDEDHVLVDRPDARPSQPTIPVKSPAWAQRRSEVEGNRLPVYFCPFTDCPRHDSGWLISKGYKFRAHMKKKHKLSNDQLKELEELLQSGQSFTTQPQPQPRSTDVWVPPDPLRCPHTDCPWAEKTFANVNRFTEHMRRKHKYDPRDQSAPTPEEVPQPQEQEDVTLDGQNVAEMYEGVHLDGFLQPIDLL